MELDNQQRRKTYQCWSDMKQRCYNTNTKQYPNYGKRGISVCDRWIDSFENFVGDMGDKPDGLTLDRINVNGNYEPENCRWATKEEQQKNRRNNRMFTHNGMTMTMRDWAKHLGRHEATLSWRVRQGYPLEMILSSDLHLFGSKKAISAMEAIK